MGLGRGDGDGLGMTVGVAAATGTEATWLGPAWQPARARAAMTNATGIKRRGMGALLTRLDSTSLLRAIELVIPSPRRSDLTWGRWRNSLVGGQQGRPVRGRRRV